MATELGEAGADSGADPALEDLQWAYRSGALIFFVGGGISVAAGLPSREGLVARLREHAAAKGAPAERLEEMTALADKQRLIDALSVARSVLDPAEFSDIIERELDDRGVDKLPDLALAIGGLRQGIRAVITTNLDHLLERAFGGAWATLTRPTTDIGQRRRFILKLHGTLSDRASWILTREDMEQSLHEGDRRQQALSALFNESALLFIGYSPADDDFDAILARLRAISGDQPPRHFALLPADTLTPYRRGKLERASVQPIAYDNADGGHLAVVHLLRRLARGGGTTDEHISVNPAPISGAVLRRGALAPFPGLASFEREDARFFFGRDAEIAAVAQKLGDTPDGRRRWLQIEGPSAVGKSSLAKAGVVPAVVERGWAIGAPDVWRVAIFRPGSDPMLTLAHAVHGALKDRLPTDLRSPGALAEALRASPSTLASLLHEHMPKGTGLLLVADQLDELFTLADEAPRAAFDAALSRALRDTDGPLYLITTLGSHLLPRFRELPGLLAILNTDAVRHDLAEMQRPGLRAAIEGPAKLVLLSFEQGLAERILEDALAVEGRLPLLANVLHALWIRRQESAASEAAYEALGGVSGALPRIADALLEGLGKDGRERAQKLLLALVTITKDGAVRAALPRSEAVQAAGSGEKGERVLARLLGERDPKKPEGAEAKVRLLSASRRGEGEEDRIELVHEALIERWGTLRKWVEERRKQLAVQAELEAAAAAWEEAGARADGLPGEDEIAALRGVAEPSERAQRFLAAAARRASRRAGRAPLILAGLAAAALGLGGLSGVLWRERVDMERQRDTAVQDRDLVQREREIAERRAAEESRALEMTRRMTPENTAIRRELAGSYNKLGDLAQAHGDVVAAREFFEKGLKLREALSTADPDDVDLQIDLALCEGRVASAAREAKDQAAFEAHRDAAKAILDKLERGGQAKENVKFVEAREWIDRMGGD